MELYKNIRPRMSVILKGEIERFIYAAKLENIVFNLGKLYYTHLMCDIYYNIRISKSLDEVVHFILLLMVGHVCWSQNSI